MVNEDILRYFREGIRRGFTISRLRSELIKNKFSEKEVDEAVDELKNNSDPIRAMQKQGNKEAMQKVEQKKKALEEVKMKKLAIEKEEEQIKKSIESDIEHEDLKMVSMEIGDFKEEPMENQAQVGVKQGVDQPTVIQEPKHGGKTGLKVLFIILLIIVLGLLGVLGYVIYRFWPTIWGS